MLHRTSFPLLLLHHIHQHEGEQYEDEQECALVLIYRQLGIEDTLVPTDTPWARTWESAPAPLRARWAAPAAAWKISFARCCIPALPCSYRFPDAAITERSGYVAGKMFFR